MNNVSLDLVVNKLIAILNDSKYQITSEGSRTKISNGTDEVKLKKAPPSPIRENITLFK